MHEKLIKQLRSDKHCSECPYNKDCDEFDSCLMDLLAADALEDMNKRIARQEKELEQLRSTMKFIIPTDIDKPLKLVYEDDVKVVENDDGTIKFVRKLKPLEAEQVLKCMFGTTDVGILNCNNTTTEVLEEIVKQWEKIK